MKKSIFKVLVVMVMVAFATTSVLAASYNLVEEHPYTPDGAWSYAVAENVEYKVMETFKANPYGAAANYWYINPDSWVGIGFSDAVEADGYLEVNVSDDNAQAAVLAFVAPNDGDYNLASFTVANLWEQESGNFYIYKNDELILEEAIGAELTVAADTLTLVEGDVLYFYSTTTGGWFSSYVSDIVIENVAESLTYSSIDDYDLENADASVVPWSYMLRQPVDFFNFYAMTDLSAEAWYDGNQFGYFYWSHEDFWTNAGVSFSAEDRIELNSDGGYISSAAVFTTPETETYNLDLVLDNLWDASAGTLYIFLNGAILDTVDLSGVDSDNSLTYDSELELEAGDELIIFATAASGWFSSYVDITIGTEVEVEPTPEPTPEPTTEPTPEPTPVVDDEDDLEEEPGDVLPIVAVLASAITAAGALTLKKRK